MKTLNWIFYPHTNVDKKTLHFYLFGKCPGYAEREIQFQSDGTWQIYFDGKKRDLELNWLNIPNTLRTYADLEEFLNTIGSMKSCQGCDLEKYKSFIDDSDIMEQRSIFNTKDGSPAAYVDIMVSKGKQKVIRSTKCIIFLVDSNVIRSPDTCEACKSTNHYLRTMLSRESKDQVKSSKKVRLDYLTQEDLLNYARNSVKEMKFWRQKCQRLEEYRNKMTSVDFRSLEWPFPAISR